MDGLLRKKDLIDGVGVAKSTLADWVTEFAVYIPTVKHGAVTYYKPESLEVLKAIKGMREKELSKVQIMELLSKQGYAINVDPEDVDDIKQALARTDGRDAIYALAVEVGRQDARITQVESMFDGISSYLNGQNGRLTETENEVARLKEMIEELKAETAAAKAEAAAAKEQANKGFWKRVFGK